ncbi:MAG: serine/threonine protein kinase [Planctomycetaceae bacterium]|jgi:serine/threonine protein kinase|nr:serine/threonine protein kinase [Planctomycetaceae bacterium]
MTSEQEHNASLISVDIDRIRENFEADWETPESQSIEETLQSVPAEFQTALLKELLYADAEFHLRKEPDFNGKDYFLRFPEHHDLIQNVLNQVKEYSATHKNEIGGCLILRELGRGGMGIVYLAEHRYLGCKVAVKKMRKQYAQDKEAVARFFREIQAMGKLLEKKHPNIVEIRHAQLDNDSSPYLVMEYVEGTSVDKFAGNFFDDSVNKGKKLGSPEHFQIMTEIVLGAAEGLDCLYASGLVHRDIKPSNLMRQPDGIIKILDLGLAKLRYSQEEQQPPFQTQSGIGTPIFMSPEQMQNLPDIDIRTDIYGLGQTFYWLLHAKYPGNSKSPETVLPPELENILKKMTSQNPNDRYQTPKLLIEDLKTFLHSLNKLSGSIVVPQKTERITFRRIAIGTSGILLIALALVLMFGKNFYQKITPIETRMNMPTANNSVNDSVNNLMNNSAKNSTNKFSQTETNSELKNNERTTIAKINTTIDEAVMFRIKGDSEMAEERLLQLKNMLELQEYKLPEHDRVIFSAKIDAALADCLFFNGLAAKQFSEKTVRQLNERYGKSREIETHDSWRLENLLKQAITQMFLPDGQKKMLQELEQIKKQIDSVDEKWRPAIQFLYRWAETLGETENDLQPIRNFLEEFQMNPKNFSLSQDATNYYLFALEYLIRKDCLAGNREEIDNDLRLLDTILLQPYSDSDILHAWNRYFDLAITSCVPNDLKRIVLYINRSRPRNAYGSRSTKMMDNAVYFLFYFSPNEKNGFAVYYPPEQEKAQKFLISVSRSQILQRRNQDGETWQLDPKLVGLLRETRQNKCPIVFSWDDSPCWSRRRDALTDEIWAFDASITLDEILGTVK